MEPTAVDPTPEPSLDCYIQVNVRFFILAFILLLCTPVIEIDGEKSKRKWGRYRFDLEPGPHKVTVWFPYLFLDRCGKNSVQVEAVPGAPVEVDFFMPPWIFAKGWMKVGPVEQPAPEGAEAEAARNKTLLMVLGGSAGLITLCCCCGGVLGVIGGSI